MSLAASIFAKLSAEGSATAALLGTGEVCKVYASIAPIETVAPYAVWQIVSDAPHNTLNEARGSGSVMVQASCVAGTYVEAEAIGDAVMADLDNQTLAAGERCTSVSAQDGYSETTDQYLRLVEAMFFVPSVAPA
jgi:hypothetical protein